MQPRLLGAAVDVLLIALVVTVVTRLSFIYEYDHGGRSFVLPLATVTAALAVVTDSRLSRWPSRRIWGPPVIVCFAALSAYGAARWISSFGAVNPSDARAYGVSWIKDLFVAGAIVVAIDSTRRLRLAALAWCAAIAAAALPTVLQWLTGTSDSDWWGFARTDLAFIDGQFIRQAGGSLESNNFAQWLVISLPIALYFIFGANPPHASVRRRWLTMAFGAGCAAIAVAALLLTRSRGGLVGLAVVLVVAIALYTSWRATLAATIAIVIVILAVPTSRDQVDRIGEARALFGGEVAGDSSAAGYASTFRAGLRMFADEPVTGVGSKNFIVHYPAISADLGIDTTGARRTTHNVAIELLSETGLVGFVTFTVGFVLVVVAIVRAKRFFRQAGALDSADLQRALLVALTGFVVTGATLNLGNPQLLLLAMGMGIAGCKVARLPSLASAGAANT